MKGTVKEISMERCGTVIIEVEDCSDLDIDVCTPRRNTNGMILKTFKV